MKQYRQYPIFINYNRFTDDERARAMAARDAAFYAYQHPPGVIGRVDPSGKVFDNVFSPDARKYLAEQEAFRKKRGDVLDWQRLLREEAVNRQDSMKDEIRFEKASKESIAYEKNVYRQLDVIFGTVVGRLLLDSMKEKVKTWIVFDDDGPGVASTTPGIVNESLGGGVRLRYNPDDFDASMEYYTPDDVLFHELVHAYRSSKGLNYSRSLPEYITAEEFLAVHMQNVFLAQRGKSRFYISHSNTSLASKDEVYQHIVSDRQTLEVFNYFRNSEPLAGKVAQIQGPLSNAWRDAAQINSMQASNAYRPRGIRMTF